jgi:hypothetical protein
MNSTKVLLAIFVVLLVVAAYFLFPSGAERETSYSSSNVELAIDSATVVKIEIRRPQKSVTLENIGGTWMVTSPVRGTANVSFVTQLIGGLKKFKFGSLVSSNPDKQNLFQVDSTGTNLLVTHRNGNSINMMVGKTGPSFSEVYVRLSNSNDVYLGEGIEPWSLNREAKDWRDKTIFKTASDSIKAMTIEYAGKKFFLQKDSTLWRAGNDTLDAGAMSSFVGTLANLNAEDFIDSIPPLTTQPLHLSLQEPETVVIDFYPQLPDSAKYIVRTSTVGQTFLVSKWTVRNFLHPLEKLLKKKK